MSTPTTQTRTEVGGGGREATLILQRELEDLEEQRRKQEERKRECTNDKDDRNNGSAENVVAQIDHIDARIVGIKKNLIEASQREGEKDGVVKIGSVLTVRTEEGDECQFVINPAGSAPAKGYITSNSVMGKALIGSQPGDEVTASPLRGPTTWTVLKVS